MINSHNIRPELIERVCFEFMCKHNSYSRLRLNTKKKLKGIKYIEDFFMKNVPNSCNLLPLTDAETRFLTKTVFDKVLAFEERELFKQVKYIDKGNFLNIVPQEGFREIHFFLGRKKLHQTHKFNLLSDPHKISYNFFMKKIKVIGSGTLNSPCANIQDLKKALSNMGIPAILSDYMLCGNVNFCYEVKGGGDLRRLMKKFHTL